MKRILIPSIAIAALIAGCGSGGSTTPMAHKTKTSTTSTTKTTTTKHKKHRKVVVKKTRRVVHRSTTSTSGGAAVTTTAVTTTAATTTSTPPPPPPPTTTHTTTHNNPPPVTTHQQPPPKKHHNGGGGGHGGYCLSVSDRIATPTGSVQVTQITPGMQVWSTDQQGRRISVKVLEVHHTAVPATHMMVSLHLADGRAVLASLGHPLPDGQPISTLSVGQRFEGTHVTSDTRVVYGKPYTYDLLPAGPTHTYFADGVLLGSTLAPADFSHLF